MHFSHKCLSSFSFVETPSIPFTLSSPAHIYSGGSTARKRCKNGIKIGKENWKLSLMHLEFYLTCQKTCLQLIVLPYKSNISDYLLSIVFEGHFGNNNIKWKKSFTVFKKLFCPRVYLIYSFFLDAFLPRWRCLLLFLSVFARLRWSWQAEQESSLWRLHVFFNPPFIAVWHVWISPPCDLRVTGKPANNVPGNTATPTQRSAS